MDVLTYYQRYGAYCEPLYSIDEFRTTLLRRTAYSVETLLLSLLGRILNLRWPQLII